MAPRNVLLATSLLTMLTAGVLAAPPPTPAPSSHPAGTPPPIPKENRPDLLVVSIDFTKFETWRDSSGALRASIVPAFTYKNRGLTRSGPFQITWEYWDYAAQKWQAHLGQLFTNDLGPGQSWSEGGQPADAFIWTVGSVWPKFRVQLDPANAVNESNETNNTLVREFRPRFPLPPPTLRPGT